MKKILYTIIFVFVFLIPVSAQECDKYLINEPRVALLETYYNADVECMKFLLKNGANPKAYKEYRDREGGVIDHPSASEKPYISDILLDMTYDQKWENIQGFHDNRIFEMMSLVLEYGADMKNKVFDKSALEAAVDRVVYYESHHEAPNWEILYPLYKNKLDLLLHFGGRYVASDIVLDKVLKSYNAIFLVGRDFHDIIFKLVDHGARATDEEILMAENKGLDETIIHLLKWSQEINNEVPQETLDHVHFDKFAYHEEIFWLVYNQGFDENIPELKAGLETLKNTLKWWRCEEAYLKRAILWTGYYTVDYIKFLLDEGVYFSDETIQFAEQRAKLTEKVNHSVEGKFYYTEIAELLKQNKQERIENAYSNIAKTLGNQLENLEIEM